MGDDRGYSPLGMILEALVAIALVGTFVIYGNPGNSQSPVAAPGELAKLSVPR